MAIEKVVSSLSAPHLQSQCVLINLVRFFIVCFFCMVESFHSRLKASNANGPTLLLQSIKIERQLQNKIFFAEVFKLNQKFCNFAL